MSSAAETAGHPAVRKIVHVDMDAFFASVEQRDDPSLRGRPVAVGGDPNRRGVVAAASYEARKFGVRSALPMARAVQLCPSLVIVRPDFSRYKAASSQVFSIFRSVTPLVEPLSLDEAYLDVTENSWGETLGVNVARKVKDEIKAATRLTASAGVAPNKFLAKIASGWRKPDGLTVIAPERVEKFLEGLPVEALWGVGKVTAARLHAIGVTRLVEIRTLPEEELRKAVGSWAEGLRELAFGRDERPVVPDRPAKSCGAERTFDSDLTEIPRMEAEVASLSARIAAWLERRGLFARTVTLKVRYAGFTTVTRSDTRFPSLRSASEIRERAVALLGKTEAGSRPVRLLGVSVHGFSTSPFEASGKDDQLSLFEEL
ncbi:MAG: DNA polymerase IV [Thermoanaerobaculia bacterium]|nr:DNA polymerase IV [Thermoanaerobaculia bacterium]